MTNLEITKLLRKVAAAYQITSEDRFRVIAYERAADSIEHLTSEVKVLWDDRKLNTIPGVGASLQQHFDELFRTGKVRHFDDIMAKVPASVFPLLGVPGVGPKKAYKLVKELRLEHSKDILGDIEKAAGRGEIAKIESFGEKSQEDIVAGIMSFRKGQIKENRMVLPEADRIAGDIVNHLKKLPSVRKADALGSLRRRVATIGDIDIAVATTKPAEVTDHFIKYPHLKLIEKGPTGASLLLHNGRQIDLRVQEPGSFGAMLQYFTGSKNHNIKLRTLAQSKGLSLNEHGIKNTKTGKTTKYETEKDFYGALQMVWMPPELREDKGEIELAQKNAIPQLVELEDIQGDLHMHTNFQFESSHDLGSDSLEDHMANAQKLKYTYIGISDHNPSITNHTESDIVNIMRMRKDFYEHKYSSWLKSVQKRSSQSPAGRGIQMFLMCEVDILADGTLALPEKAFEYVDAVIVSLHSSFSQGKQTTTERVVRGLSSHPKVRIFGHPTGRLLGKREGVELDWGKVFETCEKHEIALEINAHPERLDLPDPVVYDARKAGMKFCIDTDSHAADQMELMKYGVWVARRGWAEKDDIVNTMEYNNFSKWLLKNNQALVRRQL